jgi:GT2 family glycosyltransferase
MRVAVIVLVWNGGKFLDACLQSLLKQADGDSEVIVVDNASTDNSISVANAYLPRIKLIQNPVNLGFAGGNNVGIRATTAEMVVLLNQDTVVQPGWLSALRMTFADPSIGIVGCKALYPDGRTLQHAGAFLSRPDTYPHHLGQGEPDNGQYDTPSEPDYVSGMAFAIHRRVLDHLGGLDESYQPAYYEEVDYCYRARRAGFHILYQPRAVLLHYEATSLLEQNLARELAVQRNRLRFALAHWTLVELDELWDYERRKLDVVSDVTNLKALAHAYFASAMAVGLIMRMRQVDATLGGPLSAIERQRLWQALRSLRQQALRRLTERWRDTGASGEAAGALTSDQLFRELVELRAYAALAEDPAPRSAAPWLGPLVTTLRKWFLAVFVRPYLAPIVAQQRESNRRTIALVEALITRSGIPLLDLIETLSADEDTLVEAWLRVNERGAGR